MITGRQPPKGAAQASVEPSSERQRHMTADPGRAMNYKTDADDSCIHRVGSKDKTVRKEAKHGCMPGLHQSKRNLGCNMGTLELTGTLTQILLQTDTWCRSALGPTLFSPDPSLTSLKNNWRMCWAGKYPETGMSQNSWALFLSHLQTECPPVLSPQHIMLSLGYRTQAEMLAEVPQQGKVGHAQTRLHSPQGNAPKPSETSWSQVLGFCHPLLLIWQ